MVGNQSKSILPSGKTGSSDKRREEVGLEQSDVGSSVLSYMENCGTVLTLCKWSAVRKLRLWAWLVLNVRPLQPVCRPVLWLWAGCELRNGRNRNSLFSFLWALAFRHCQLLNAHLGTSPHQYMTTLVNMCKCRAQVFCDKRHPETPRVLGCIIAMITIVYVIRGLRQCDCHGQDYGVGKCSPVPRQLKTSILRHHWSLTYVVLVSTD